MQLKKNLFSAIILLLISIALFYHLSSLFSDYRLRYVINEDGYYMITIARNIALGLGMTIAEGQIPTNGVQPFYTFVLAGVSWLANSDKILILKLIVIVQLFVSISIFALIWRIGNELFKERKNSANISLFAASVWFSNPLSLLQQTNGLETGLYTISILLFVWLLLFKIKTHNIVNSVVLGIFLGIIFLIRNDGVFFITAVCVFVIFYKSYDKEKVTNNLIHSVIIGLISAAIALPWLIYNLKFGSIVPISGHAESISEAEPIYKYVTTVFVEYLLSFYAIPLVVKDKAIVIIISSLITIVIFALLFKNYKKFTEKQKQIFLLTVFFLFCLGIFYGIFFKTYYFLERYLFPVSPFIYLLWSFTIFKLFAHIRFRTLKYTLAGLFFAYFSAISLKNYTNDYQLYFSTSVKWVEKNVKENEWIAALNSGMLGYYHDRTINLDGKVNPYALDAIKQNRLWDYFSGLKVDYLVHDIQSMNDEFIRNNYDLVYKFEQKNIGIYKKKKNEQN